MCLIHAVWMMCLSWVWMGLNYNMEIEENLVKWTSIVKRHTVVSSAYQDTISLEEYSFIDVSGAKKLISREYSEGNFAITDRLLLDSLFRIVKKYPNDYSFILCDIFFESETSDDTVLSATLSAIPNVIFAYQYVNDQIVLPAIPNLPVAYTGYKSSSGIGMTTSFLKYNLIEGDTMTGVPLKMFLDMNGLKAKKKFGLVWIGGTPSINTSILDIRIQPADLYDRQGFSRIVPLGEVLALRNDSLIFDIFFRNKIVIIGDFESDLHESVYGKMPGTLILVNMFESIRRGDAYIKWGLLLFVLISYGIFSYIILYYKSGAIGHRIKKFSYPLIGAVGSKLIGYSFGLYFISVIAYFTYGVHMDILAMATYLSIVSIVNKKINERKIQSHR